MINHNEIQSFIITQLKSNIVLVNLMGGSDEIREYQWAGIRYEYPAIRVSSGPQSKTDGVGCLVDITVSIMVYTKDTNDYALNDIVNAICDIFEDKSLGRYKTGRQITISKANREGDIWHREITISATTKSQ